MKAIIFSNGQIYNYKYVKDNISHLDNPIIICCDGGVKHVKELNIIPSYILGDLDSASEEIIKYYESLKVSFKIFSSKKDETDTEIGIEFALSCGVNFIDLYGCTGTRLDHTLANFHNLLKALKQGVKARIIDEHNIIQIIDKDISFYDKIGKTISLIPLTTQVTGIVTSGMEYPLNKEALEIGTSRGISNIVSSKIAKIEIESGYLFVIESHD